MTAARGSTVNAPTESAPVQQLAQAWREGRRISACVEKLRQPSVQEALAIQAEVTRTLGHSVAGWKAALNPAGEVLYAPIYAALAHECSAHVPLTFSGPAAVEVEIAFVLGRDLSAEEEPLHEDAVRAAISQVALGLEIVQSRFLDDRAPSPEAWLADNLGNGSYVLGAPVPLQENLDLRNLQMTAFADGECFWSGPAEHAQGDPLIPLVRLANVMGRHLGGLCKGQFVATGNLCSAPRPIAGPTAIWALASIGSVAATIIPVD